MTDHDGHEPAEAGQRSELGEVLDSLKRRGVHADESGVTGGQARMSWRSVTEEAAESPAPEAPAPDRSSFQFDLGSALQRLGGPSADEPAPPAQAAPPMPGPVAQPTMPSAPEPMPGPVAHPDPSSAPEPLPTRAPAARTDPPPAPPTLDPLPTRAPAAQPAPTPDPLPTRTPAATPDPLPTRTPAAMQQSPDPLPTRDAAMQQSPDPLPTRSPAMQQSPDPLPSRDTASAPGFEQRTPEVDPLDVPRQDEPVRRSVGSAVSVFDDAPPAPTLPTGAPTIPAAAVETPPAPVIPPADMASLPSLPAPAPAAPPLVEPLTTATAANDINAVRSVQMRAKRDERRGKMFSRTFLALVVLAGAVGGALVFGRDLLFPTQWDAGLTSAVDAVQERRDAEFPSTVPLRVSPDAEYAGLAIETWFGTEWTTRYADWRALGLASGAADSEAVASAIVAWRPAFYDPLTDTVYRAESATDEAAAPALRLALEEVFERQSGATPPEIDEPPVGVLSAGSEAARNARAIDRELLVGAAPTFTLDGAGAPLPMLVEMGVADMFGDEFVATAIEAGQPVAFGEPYPDAALTATAADARRALGAPLPPDVEPAGDPVAWGPEQWALVLDNRLPDTTVDRLTSLIAADSYRPVVRAGTRCFVAQFQATGAETATELLGGLTRWAVGAPASATASATQLTPNTIELFACDPGADVDVPLDRVAVDGALARLGSAPAG